MTTDYFNTDNSAPFVTYFKGKITESYGDTPANQAVAAGREEPTFQSATQTRIYWAVQVDDVIQEWDNIPPELITVNWSLGKDWQADESGLVLRHKDDPGDELVEAGKAKPILFREDSGYGTFLSIIRGAKKGYDTKKGAPKVMDGGPKNLDYDFKGLANWFRTNGVTDSRNLDIWVGHSFLFRGLELQFGGNFEASTKPLPVAWLGYSEDVDSPNSSAGGASSAPTQVDPADVAVTLPPDTAPEVVDQLAQLVTVSANHSQFMKNALVVDGVGDNSEVKAAVMDQANGPWSARK